MFSTLQKVSILAKGRYSEIYKFLDTTSTDLFVIKKHPKVIGGSLKECNVRELEVYNRIYTDKMFTHKNIIKFYGYVEDEDDGYFKLEYVNGYDLNRIINESKTNKIEKYISKEKIINYIVQVIDGLEFLHSKGVYHCDVKPENILIYKDSVKIVDFGSSIISDKKVINIKDDDFIGTPGYLPQEVADFTYKGDINLEYVDIFGLGCTLYFCLTKKIPFAGELRCIISNNVKNMNVDLFLVEDEEMRNIVRKIFFNKEKSNLGDIKRALLSVRNV
ncbi:death-associated protein kinase 2 [Vairimorpha necatrix]|uniref:Death-associated protein kinase 2 n=1 Tax=Vairimorpha necatrix TaxID=6039 RepID=A0AAX4JC46_9MICR